MDKRPFVTKEKVEKITKYIRLRFIFMMKKESEKM